MSYAVVQTELTELPIEALRRAFRHVPGLTALDAQVLGNDAFGILVKDFPLENATAMQGALRSEGIETEIVETARLPAMPPAKQLRRLSCSEAGLELFDPLGRGFVVAWQHVMHQPNGPGFQRFRHQCVVGVRECFAAQRPRLVPRHAVVIAQDTHQLGYPDRGVSVVEVNGHFVGQIVQRWVLSEMTLYQVLDGCSDKEILLLQPQFASCGCAVVGIKHPGNVFVFVLCAGRACVVASVECPQINMRRCDGLPQTQRADFLGTVARNHHVVGFSVYLPCALPDGFAIHMLNPATKPDRIHDVCARKFPGCAVL